MIARSLEASLTLLHVGHDPAAGTVVGSPELLEAEQRARDRKLEHLRDRARMRSGGRPVTVAVVRGDPAAQIVRFASEGKFDLLALGTHGRAGLRRTILGSVAEAVVRRARCPVLTLHAAAEDGDLPG